MLAASVSWFGFGYGGGIGPRPNSRQRVGFLWPFRRQKVFDLAESVPPSVAVLFARSDSIYKSIQGLDVFDISRDARSYRGSLPVVAHPPCRAWGRLRAFAKPRQDEKYLALFAVDTVQRCGGVLEHPEASSLWRAAGLPPPGWGQDEYGGWTLPVVQHWWGHRARKSTWLYIVGVSSRGIPDIPLVLGEASHTVGLFSGRDRATCRPEIGKAEREATPPEFARWLIDLASRSSIAVGRSG